MRKNLFLDLQNNNGTVPYKINFFPDGQRSITLLNPSELYKSVNVIIIKSITNFSDLELILSAVSALKDHTYEYELYAPYIIGARSDRKFLAGGDRYFDEVVTPILDSCDFRMISTIDLHCDKSFIINVSAWALSEYSSNKNIIFPDNSAYERFLQFDDPRWYVVMDKERIGSEVKQFTKTPEKLYDITGRHEEIVIFDDLFDGGASFINLCKYIRNDLKFTGKLTIFVSHFIGSNAENIKKLESLDVGVVTTNSYPSQNLLKNTKIIDVFGKEVFE